MDRDLRSCVHPEGRFVFGVHRPTYHVINNRLTKRIEELGQTREGKAVINEPNFPDGDLEVTSAQHIYEIPNAFPFWGTTYILGDVAARAALLDKPVSLAPKGKTDFASWDEFHKLCLEKIPRPVLIAVAQSCRDPEILSRLLPLSAEFVLDQDGTIRGLRYQKADNGQPVPCIKDHDLFETLGNNPSLPDELKQVMLLRPGVQGRSPIVGEYVDKDRCHIWEYLRANSYIAWGHYAANMAEDSIRYSVAELDLSDMTGLRHLYYQRIFTSLASELGILGHGRRLLTKDELEELRCLIKTRLDRHGKNNLRFSATLWGWNYGYDFSPSGFRLHASHQQIHQQFALIPESVEGQGAKNSKIPSYAVGDMVSTFAEKFEKRYGKAFFTSYINAIFSNSRTDGRDDLEHDLLIFRDENVMLFVPKAQRFHGELQIMCLKEVGNILEADIFVRSSLDLAIFLAVRILHMLGARMITTFELSKRFTSRLDQRLMYCFVPRHPQSPGAFSEHQARWITGHFPEDFARSCRSCLSRLREEDFSESSKSK